jgi:hypothetical protein
VRRRGEETVQLFSKKGHLQRKIGTFPQKKIRKFHANFDFIVFFVGFVEKRAKNKRNGPKIQRF